ncbi:hypothetical protein A2U01_0017028 [Trifolium medium]|uniref:Uncharacterized protein n=1 Tax=Trifolium medium TaxID=97028 RepID=A0A392NAA7_9FABA|nr:hypothetical protein [Trifolium medium]
MISELLRNQETGSSLGERSLAGRETFRSFLAPASKFQVAVKACSLGEEDLAGRAHAEVSPI